MITQTIKVNVPSVFFNLHFLEGLQISFSYMANFPGSIVCNFVLGLADQHFQSWSYWDTASGGVLWDSEGEPVMDSVKYDYEDV